MGYAKVCNHPQWLKTTYNHPQLPKKLTTTTQKKANTCHKQWCYLTLNVNTETAIDFWQWY